MKKPEIVINKLQQNFCDSNLKIFELSAIGNDQSINNLKKIIIVLNSTLIPY